MSEMQRIEMKISEVEAEIRTVRAKVDAVDIVLASFTDFPVEEERLSNLRDQRSQNRYIASYMCYSKADLMMYLMDEKKSLMDKEKSLMDKEKSLMDERKALSSKAQQTGEHPAKILACRRYIMCIFISVYLMF
jgi:hypothetical protein